MTLGDTALITAPTDRAAAAVRTALDGLPTTRLTDPATVTGLLTVSDTLGPATLAYLTPEDLRPPASTGTPTEQLPSGHAALRALSEEAGETDAGESGLEEITSPVFVVRDGRARVLAAAGYAHWPRDTAHLCVLTAPDARGGASPGGWRPRPRRTPSPRVCSRSGGPGRPPPAGWRRRWATGSWGLS